MSEHVERHSGSAGLPPREEVPTEAVEAIERDRTDRLDPGNRPESAEVDNTDRTFDPETGMFTDSEGYAQAEKRYDADDEA